MLSIFIFLVFAQSAPCTDWNEGPFELCTFNGESMRTWTRTCLNAKDKEEVCWSANPNTIEGPCSEWFAQRTRCTKVGGGFGTRWVRTCKTVDDKTEICLDSNPNTLTK